MVETSTVTTTTLTAPGQVPSEQLLWSQLVSAPSIEAFARAWLALQCRQIDGALGGAVLLGPADKGPYAPVAVWPQVQRSMDYLSAAAEQALRERRAVIVQGEEARVPAGANLTGPTGPSARFHLAYPLEVSGELHGVVVVEASARPEPELQAVLRQLHWGVAWLEVQFHRERVRSDETLNGRLYTVLDLSAIALEEPRFQSACAAVVTELATRLDCDRVSIGFVKRGQAAVQAISHSASFGKEMNLVALLGRAMDEAIDQECAVRFPAPPETGFIVTRAHDELSQQHKSRCICTVPIALADGFPGALTLERPGTREFSLEEAESCETLAALIGPILLAKRDDERWLAVKAAHSVRDQLARLFGPRYLLRKALVALLVAVAGVLSVATGEYRVAADTTLEGAVQRAIVAPLDGYLSQAVVRAGDIVAEGALLAALDDKNLKFERVKLSTQRAQLERERREAVANRERARVNILTAQIAQAEAQIDLTDQQLERLTMNAPFDGVIVSGDLSQALGAPMQRGDMLYEIAPLDEYRLVLKVEDRDITDVAHGQRGELVLSALPDVVLGFTVSAITPITMSEEGRNLFRVEATLDESNLRLRPGMEGIGKVLVDRRRLIGIWTRPLVHWLKLQLWAWWPNV